MPPDLSAARSATTASSCGRLDGRRQSGKNIAPPSLSSIISSVSAGCRVAHRSTIVTDFPINGAKAKSTIKPRAKMSRGGSIERSLTRFSQFSLTVIDKEKVSKNWTHGRQPRKRSPLCIDIEPNAQNLMDQTSGSTFDALQICSAVNL